VAELLDRLGGLQPLGLEGSLDGIEALLDRGGALDDAILSGHRGLQ
jgi:hypothetical protein